MRLLRALPLVALLGLLLAVPAHATTEIAVTADGFDPPESHVDVGDPVLWRNATDGAITIVAEEGSWDSGPLEPGDSFSLAFREPGEHDVRAEGVDASATVLVTGDPSSGALTTVADTLPTLPETGFGTEVLGFLGMGLVIGGGVLLRSTRTRKAFEKAQAAGRKLDAERGPDELDAEQREAREVETGDRGTRDGRHPGEPGDRP